MDTDEITKIICVPGEKICKADEFVVPGIGAYKDNEFIYASLAGEVMYMNDNGTKTISIRGNFKTDRILPQPGDIVTCQITSTQTNIALCNIKCCNDQVLRQPYRAMIRKDEIRLQDKDLTDISKCCLPGDVVIGKVVGTGDNGRYLVSIADKEFGVVMATSEAGSTLVPVNTNEMVCPKTDMKEERKVSNINLKNS